MNVKKRSGSTTFLKFDKVNGRSYKTVRSRPAVGPMPSVNMYSADPKPAEQQQHWLDDVSDLRKDSQQLDQYSEYQIEEALDSDAIESWEAGMMRGYTTL